MTETVHFSGADGQKLAGRLDLPEGRIQAFALFAHCFSCSKDIVAAREIARTLAAKGIGVLRFDFTGLGASEGAFSDTNFSTNLADLEAAAHWLEDNYAAASLLVGHSLGGAAVVAVADRLPSVRAIATIGAPSDAGHVIHQFGSKLDEIAENGEAEVLLAGRPFHIKQQFVEDVSGQKVKEAAANLRRPLLVMHAPRDAVVGIDNATGLFLSAKHPKSFISLDDADHLLSRKEDARYAGEVIAGWAGRYVKVSEAAPAVELAAPGVRVEETRAGKYEARVSVGSHSFLSDEPAAVGGRNAGPSPYDLLAAGLGACTVMTLRMYADRKGWPVERVTTTVTHAKDYADDCDHCEDGRNVDVFERTIKIDGDLDADQHARMIEIADKCPVHRTLEGTAHIRTHVAAE
ncbi:MAG: bifunctional alpha/beta hydrolase/OsmC family protein [Pseudomonadota bacterium]